MNNTKDFSIVYSNNNYVHSELTEKIIKEAFHVHRTLGYGFLEKVYENSLRKRLVECGFKVKQQEPIKVKFEGEVVGEYFSDLLVENTVIIELKSIEKLIPIHEVQLVNYLKATSIEVGLLLNFSHVLEIKRKIYSKNSIHKSQR